MYCGTTNQWHCGFKKVGEAEVAIFQQTVANFRQQIMGAQNFNFPPEFSQNGFLSTNCTYLDKKKFRQEEFSTIF